MSAIIYRLTNTVNQKTYVGLTTQGLERRWKKHCSNARRGSSCHLHNAIRKYGEVAFRREIMETTTVALMNEREQYWIDKERPAYNMTAGGGGMVGYVPTAETRSKLSSAHTGTKNPNWGKTHSDETKAKMSAARTGKTHSDETKAKMSAQRTGDKHPYYGKKHSPETKEKIRIAALGRKATEETKVKMRATHLGENNYMYGREHSTEVKEKCRAAAKLQARMKRISAPTATINIE